VIRREPNHLGAVHYYIHPWKLLIAGTRLAARIAWAELAAAAGHIVHMPAHIYIRTAIRSCRENQSESRARDQAYIKAGAAEGIYSMMYYSHNLHFIAMAAAMNGNIWIRRRRRCLRPTWPARERDAAP